MMSDTRKVVTRERPGSVSAATNADEAWKRASMLPMIARLEGLAVEREGATK
jgi:hypothetical protein